MLKRLVFFFLLLAPPAFAQHTVSEIGVEFPATLGGYPFAGVTRFPQPGAGIGIRYERDGVRADLFIYTRNIQAIGDGTTHPTVAREFEQSREEALAGYRARGEQVEVTRTDGVLDTGTAPRIFQWRVADFSVRFANGQMMQSYLLVAGFRGQFIKLRMTHPVGVNVRAFGDALGQLMAAAASGQPQTPPATPPAK